MFREALEAARSADGGDAWAESRSLVGIANVISPVGDEEEALRVGHRGARRGGGRRPGVHGGRRATRPSRHRSAASLRLDEALEHADAAIRTFRELGARWELASALGNRGSIYRMAGRLEEAETDLREAFVLCRDLQERALVTWIAAELARILAVRGDPSAARQVLYGPVRAAGRRRRRRARPRCSRPNAWWRSWKATRQPPARRRGSRSRRRRAPATEANVHAAQVWWAGRLFGAGDAGGEEAMHEARDMLERHHWMQALREPDLASDLRR